MTLKHPLANCSQCPLRDDKYVPSEIHPGAKLAVVGEAPGFQEATRGRPFTGPSGQLIERVLKHHGYTRKDVLWTNVVSCRPPHNATPPKAAADACRPRLLSELSESGVRDIAALGGTAASATCDDTRNITKLRVGPPKTPARDLGGSGIVRVVPTWHPAYCLRNADAFPALVGDIGKLHTSAANTWRPPDWKYFEAPHEAVEVTDGLMAWQDLEKQYELVIDVEWGWDKDDVYDHPNLYDLLCVGLGYAPGKVVVIGEEALKDPNVREKVKELFYRSKLIAHNGKSDLEALYPLFGPLELWYDTMLANYCLDERPGNHGLKVRAIEDLGAPDYARELDQYVPKGGSYANIPRPILYRYNAYDISCTYGLFAMQVARLESTSGLRELHDFLVAASNQLMYLELNGITIDRVYQSELRSIFLRRLAPLEDGLDKIVKGTLSEISSKDGVFNPRSPKQIKEWLVEQGIEVPSTNEDTLKQLLEILARQRVESDHPVIQFVNTLLVHRRQQKLFSTYVEGIRKRMYRGRVYTTYMLHGTTSGRLASRNPNLQNIVRDKDIRRQFSVAKPENVFIQCDYANAEARVMATLAQDGYLRQLLSNPDPKYKFFNELSDQLFGEGKWGKEEYVRAKAFFYGLGYGREAYSIAMEYGMPVREAERLRDDFLKLIPQVVQWQQQVWEKVLNGEDLVTTFNRRRRFWLITDQNQKEVRNEALSFLPQSTASDICLRAAIRVRPRLRGLGFLRLTIHDALVAECHEDRQEEVARILVEEMERSGAEWTNYVPFPVDTSVGKSWGDL